MRVPFVVACLSVGIGILLSRLWFSPLSDITWRRSYLGQQDEEPDEGKDIPDWQQCLGHEDDDKEASVPYNADTVTARRLDKESVSVTGRPCGGDKCSYRYKGTLNSVLLTRDKRLLVLIPEAKTLHVHSATGVKQILLKHDAWSFTQLPTGLLAVTCPDESLILLVDIDSDYHIVQVIRTWRKYVAIVPGFVHNTLIVTSWANKASKGVVDVINLQGDVIRTYVDSSIVKSLARSIHLSKIGQYILVCSITRESTMFRIGQSKCGAPTIDVYTDTVQSNPLATAVDKAGNMFICRFSGRVALITKDGKYRLFMLSRDKQFGHCSSLLVHEDRLVVAWEHYQTEYIQVMEYHLFDKAIHE